MSWLFKDPAVIMKVIVSWLLKDPIVTVTWVNLNYAQSQSKKWPQGLKRSTCSKWTFFSKSNKIFMYLLVPFILQNFKRIFCAHPELSGCVIFSDKIVHLSWTNLFWFKPLLLLSSTCWSFLSCKIYKIFLWLIQNWEDAPFFGPKWSICPQTIFFGKLLYHFHLTISSFHWTKFQKNPSSGSWVTNKCNFWAYNNPFAQMRFFFRKPVNEPSFFHSCLSTYQKSKPDINLLAKYWQLKNTEI